MVYFFLASALYFLGATIFNIRSSVQKIKPFKNHCEIKSHNGLILGSSEFIEDFNKYLEGMNKENSINHIISAGVNTLACVAALLAACSV